MGGGGLWGIVNQVMLLEDWDMDLGPEEWWVVFQGSNAEGGKKGKGERGKNRKRKKEGGTFRVPSSILFATREKGGVAPPRGAG